MWGLRVDYMCLSIITETFRCWHLASPTLFLTLLCIFVFIFIHSVCVRVAYVCMNANVMFHNVHVELRGQYSGASSHLPPHRVRVSCFCCCAVVCSRLAGPWASVPVSYLCLPYHCRVLILQMHMISAFRLEFCRSNYGPLVCDQHLHSLSRLPSL